jgi:hypothetical protein
MGILRQDEKKGESLNSRLDLMVRDVCESRFLLSLVSTSVN